jgi:hypothetical protein
MFNFITNFLAKRTGKNEYYQSLINFLQDGILAKIEKTKLEGIKREYNLSDNDLKLAQQKAASLTFQNITSDNRITEDEKKSLSELTNYFGITNEVQFDEKTFNKFYSLGLIDKGVLPQMKKEDLDIIFKENEVLHWASPGSLKKYKNTSKKINYYGPAGSVKIIKGIQYRVGSIDYQVSNTEELVVDDVGTFWITNDRIGFKGNRKSISFPHNKLHIFEIRPEGLFIFKEGREKPYIFELHDYEVPAMIVSHLLNK